MLHVVLIYDSSPPSFFSPFTARGPSSLPLVHKGSPKHPWLRTSGLNSCDQLGINNVQPPLSVLVAVCRWSKISATG